MSNTRFAARKLQDNGAEREAVNWMFIADLSTMALSISEKSGIVKVDLGLGRRNPSLYANEIRAILEKGPEILRYLEDHPQAKDTPATKAEQRVTASLTKEVLAAHERQTYRQAMVDAGLSETQADAATVKKFGSI